jgi:hypothetical protein
MWTVEWIQEDGSKLLQHRCSDKSTLEELYNRLPGRLKAAPQTAGKKRKRIQVQSTQENKALTSAEAKELSSSIPESVVQVEVPKADAPVENQSSLVTYHSDPEDSQATDPQAKGEKIADEQSQEGIPESQPSEAIDEPQRYFYLVKPKTSGKQRVLIRTKPTLTLEENLYRQEVLEFPTFQVLAHHWKSLPDDYILDMNYELKMRVREEEMKRLVDSSGLLLQKIPDSLPEASPSAWAVKSDQEILASLQKDIS